MTHQTMRRHAKPALPTPLGRPLLTLMALAALSGLAGCGAESEEKLLASAKAFVEKNDNKAAVIQLKSALQANPKSAEARLMLGKALRDTGDAAGAMLELRKAQELGVPDEQLLPELARTMLMVGDAKLVAGQYASTELKDPKAAADLAISVATAFAAQRDKAKALEFSNKALQAVPGYAPAVVLQAQIQAAEGDLDGALFLLDELLAKSPDDQRAGLFKADLLWQGKRQREQALAVYQKVSSAHPQSVGARLGTVNLLFELDRAEEARAALEALKKIAPQHPDTLFQEARQAFKDKQFETTRELTGRVLKALPNNPAILELAGAAELQLGAIPQAEALLSKALKAAPDRLMPRHLLAQLYTRSGQAQRALEVLQPVVDSAKADGISLTLAGEAHLQVGDVPRANEAFKRATKASPQDPRVRAASAMAQISYGVDTGRAVVELEALAAADPKSSRADVALIAGKLQQRDLAGALKAIDALKKKQPDGPLADLLQGRVLALKGDTAGARAAFEASLRKTPAYYPAVASLATLDMAAKRPDEARKRFEALIQADPRHFRAHLALAEIAAQPGGNAPEVLRHLTGAVAAAPAEAAPRVLLVKHLLRTQDHKAALTAGQDAQAALPNNPEVLEALSAAQLAAGDAQQGTSTAKRLAAMQPTSAEAQMRLAEAYRAAKDSDGAKTALRRAIELKPSFVPAWRALASMAMAEKKPEEAMGLARDLQKSQPRLAAGHLMEGNIEGHRQNWPAAIAALKQARQREPSSEVSLALHAAYTAANQRQEADRLATDWLRAQPEDAAFVYYLGDLALARNDWPGAEARYKAVLKLQPRNALAMNNLAWLMAKQGQPGAVAMATEANALLPERAPLLDTLAGALAAEGQLPKAIETQKKAVQLAPADGQLQLTLAKLYLKAGDKTQAHTTLQAVAKLGDRFAGQKEVAELLKTAP